MRSAAFATLLAGLAVLASCGRGEDHDACSSCCSLAAKQVIEAKFLKPSDSRTFSVEYVAKVSDIPAGTKKLRLWIPVPEDSTVQTIKNLKFSKEPSLGSDMKFDNKIAYYDLENPGASVEVTL